MAEHHRELLQLIEGSPSELSVAELGRAIGVSPEEADRLVADLERAGHVTRKGDRLIVVESHSGDAPT